MVALRGYSGARLFTGYRHDCPRPGAGEEAGGRAGWGLRVSHSAVETGEGETPSPSAPPPRGDIPTVHLQ
ncbi:MAG: hypothetical protein XE10_1858, partial [Methanoculleus marisnigri]